MCCSQTTQLWFSSFQKDFFLQARGSFHHPILNKRMKRWKEIVQEGEVEALAQGLITMRVSPSNNHQQPSWLIRSAMYKHIDTG